MAKRKVKPITKGENGEIIINLAAFEGTDDWIRAGRLKQQGKTEEYNRMMNTPMYEWDEEE